MFRTGLLVVRPVRVRSRVSAIRDRLRVTGAVVRDCGGVLDRGKGIGLVTDCFLVLQIRALGTVLESVGANLYSLLLLELGGNIRSRTVQC